MAVSVSVVNPTNFTSDNVNLIRFSSTLQNSSVFWFKVEVRRAGVLVGVEKVFKSLIPTTDFDLSIYTRYLTPIGVLSTYTVKVIEVVNGVDGSSATTSNIVLTKGWLTSTDQDFFDQKGSFFFTKFYNINLDSAFVSEFKFSFKAVASTILTVTKYDVNNVPTTQTTPYSAGIVLDETVFLVAGAVRADIILSVSGTVSDTIKIQITNECAVARLTWLNSLSMIETFDITHNLASKTNINTFDYESNLGKTPYLKTFRNGGTLYTQDLTDMEQLKLKTMLTSPSISIEFIDNFGQFLTKQINVTASKFELNQTYFEDSQPMSIEFEFTELEKSILL